MADLFNMNLHLHFGATVYLSCFVNRRNCYLFSNGISFKNMLALYSTDRPVEISQVLFKIVPPMKFKSDEMIRRILKERYRSDEIPTKSKEAKALIEQFQFQLKESIKLVEQQNGFPVKYQQHFLLQHCYSNKFLTYVLAEASQEYLLELTEVPNQNCLFSLKPCFNYQKDINVYIPFNSTAILNMKIMSGLEIKDLYLSFQEGSAFESWGASEETRQPISIGLYRNAEELDHKQVCYGDTLWVFHLESGSFLKVIDQKDTGNCFILDQIKHKLGYFFSNEERSVEDGSLARIFLQKCNSQKDAEKMGLWQIVYASKRVNEQLNWKRHSDRFQGGRIRFDHEVRFFNLRYQSYLGVRKIKTGRNKFAYKLSLEKLEEQTTSFRIVPLEPGSTFVTVEDLFLIQHAMYDCYLTLQGDFVLNNPTAPLEPSAAYRKEDNFKFTKIEFFDEWQNNYILSVLPFIKEGSKILERTKDAKFSPRDHTIAQLCLENLVEVLMFSYDLTEGFEASENKLGKMTYDHQRAQQLLKEQGVFKEIIHILQLVDPKLVAQVSSDIRSVGSLKILKDFTPGIEGRTQQIEDSGLIAKIVHVSLKILRNCCKSNPLNGLQAFNNLRVLVKFLEIEPYADQLFSQAFSNPILQEKFMFSDFKLISDHYLEVNSHTRRKSIRMFGMLEGLICSEGKSSTKNQLFASQLFLEKRTNLTFYVREQNQQIFVEDNGIIIELMAFCSQNPEDQKVIAAQFSFYAALCANRNYVASKKMKKLFPIQTIIRYMVKNWGSQVLASLITIAIHAFVNERPRFESVGSHIYSLQSINSSRQLREELGYSAKETLNSRSTEYELKELKQSGIPISSLEQIITCVTLTDELGDQNLLFFKQWVQTEMTRLSEKDHIEELFSLKAAACLELMKKLIKLSLLTAAEVEQAKVVIERLVERVNSNFQVQAKTRVTLKNENFSELLLEMINKNVIKRFNNAGGFDGIGDQINSSNICSIYVNYTYYQNILFLEKSAVKNRKIADTIIAKVLQLIECYAKVEHIWQENQFIGRALDSEARHIDLPNKAAAIEQIFISAFQSGPNSSTIKLLVNLFYNSNSYKINYFTIKLISEAVLSDRRFLHDLSSLVVLVDEEQTKLLHQFKIFYKQIRLLIETSQVWLGATDRSFVAVTVFFSDRLRKLTRLIVPGFRLDSQSLYESIVGLQGRVNPQTRIMLAQLNYDYELFELLESNAYIIQNRPYNESLELFRNCFVMLYLIIYDCPENKHRLKQRIGKQTLMHYFSRLSHLELGQTRLIIEYLRDNYQQCIDFWNEAESISITMHSAVNARLHLALIKLYEEPILTNLRKFFVQIFDYASFKNFMWLNKQGFFETDFSLLTETAEPIFYHINAIECIVFLMERLPQSRNTLRNHFKKSFSHEYLFKLLMQDDYFTLENSTQVIHQLNLLFKSRILQIIELVYLGFCNKELIQLLYQYDHQLTAFIDQAPLRKQTEDYRKIIQARVILRDPQQHQRIKALYDITFKGVSLIKEHLRAVERIANAVMINDGCKECEPLAESIKSKIETLKGILHIKLQGRKQVVYKIPNRHMLNLHIRSDSGAVKRKKYYQSLLLETRFDKNVFANIQKNEIEAVQDIFNILSDFNLKQILFLRKITQFLEDMLQKINFDETGLTFQNTTNVLSLLRLMIKASSKPNDFRTTMGKSQIVFPILSYFEHCAFTRDTRQLFLNFLELINTLLGDQGHKFVQNMFYQYFSGSGHSTNFFRKMKNLFKEMSLHSEASMRSHTISDSMEAYEAAVQNKLGTEQILLNFFMGLCKGSFKPNQIYLGSLSSISQFNVMAAIESVLSHESDMNASRLINSENFKILQQCFSTIKQLVEGPCTQNQNQFLKRQFFVTLIKFLNFEATEQNITMDSSIETFLAQLRFVSDPFAAQLMQYLNRKKITRDWMISQIKYRLINLICSLLSENITEKSVAQLVSIPTSMLVDQIDRVYHRFEEIGLPYDQSNLDITPDSEVVLPLGFKLYQLLQYYPKLSQPKQTKGLTFFREHSRRIEVLHENLTLVVFPKPSIEISQAFKKQFLSKVDRTSINSKLVELQSTQIQNRQSDASYGWVLLLSAIILVVLDLTLYIPLNLEFVKELRLYSSFDRYDVGADIEVGRVLLLSWIILLSIVFFALQVKGAVFIRETISGIIAYEGSTRIQKALAIASLMKSNLDYFHQMRIMVVAVLGIYNPFFDSIILIMELYRRSETFYLIVTAIVETLDQLCVVLLINFIATYVITSIIYYYNASVYYSAECATLYNCYVFSLDLGFKADAGMVGYTDSDLLNTFVTIGTGDVVMNFAYLFIIKVIIDQIIGAVIVDKFAQIRQQRDNMEADEESTCFICGIDRNRLDREEDGFEKHKTEYHNVWSYLQFLIYIREAKLSNLSGIQRFVYEEQLTGKLRWFPINRSFHLENRNLVETEEVETEGDLHQVQKTIETELQRTTENLRQLKEIAVISQAKDHKKDLGSTPKPKNQKG